jgi:hypothetical protein
MNDHTEAPSVLNRYALVIQPTASFLEWLRSTPDSDDLGEKDIEFEHTVYLVPETEGEPESIAQKHYQAIFEQELTAWCRTSPIGHRSAPGKHLSGSSKSGLAAWCVTLGASHLRLECN